MGIQSVDRAAVILRLLSRHDEGLPISVICTKLGLALGTVHRFLHSLMDNGLVQQDDRTRFYRLGLEVLRLSSSMVRSDRLADSAREPMQRAADKLGNIVYLSRASGSSVVCISCVNDDSGASQAQFAAQIGGDMPVHASAAGKIILAYAASDRREAVIRKNSPLEKFTVNTRTERAEVLADLERCRTQGYAVCDEELQLGVVAVAAPVFGYDGSVKASVAATGIKANVSIPVLVASIVRCAAEISRLQGYVE